MTTLTRPARAGWLSRHPRARLLAASGYAAAALAFFTHQKLIGSEFGAKAGALLLAATAGVAIVETVRLIYIRAGRGGAA